MDVGTLSPLLQQCPYPEQHMELVSLGIEGSGFYPAARGHRPDNSPVGGIMLLGRDWGTVSQYARWSGLPAKDEKSSTLRNVSNIYLSGLGDIPVWCTNYLLGLRKTGSAVGNLRYKIEAAEWKAFEGYCWNFLQHQVLLQAPKLIVIFGDPNRCDLSAENRFGHSIDMFTEFTFSVGAKRHRAQITFADHPYSLISKTSRLRATEQVSRIKARFESLR